MEDAGWLRLITIGLVLAAMAIAYFLLAQRFNTTNVSNSQVQRTAQPSATVLGANTSPIPLATSSPLPTATPATQSANQKGTSGTTKGGIAQLPSTGFPISLLAVFASGAVAAGWGLRKFPQ